MNSHPYHQNLRPPPNFQAPPPPPNIPVTAVSPFTCLSPPPPLVPRSNQFSQTPIPLPTSGHSKLTELAQILEKNQIAEIHGLQIYIRNLNQKQFHEAVQQNHWIEQTKIDFIENLMLLGQIKLQSLRLLTSINTATVLSQE